MTAKHAGPAQIMFDIIAHLKTALKHLCDDGLKECVLVSRSASFGAFPGDKR